VTTTIAANDTAAVTEAILIACALAREGKPLVGTHIDYITRTYTDARAKYTDADLLSWRDHVSPGDWDYTWSWARRATRTHFDKAEGVAQLPADHTQLPTAPAATP